MLRNNWKELLTEESVKPYYKDMLKPFVEHEYATHVVYPEKRDIFKALELTPLQMVKVVILGQDPYHEPNQAMGLSFSVPDRVEIPPSLANIYKEIDKEYGRNTPASGNLERWARQGVLLLNTVLTVRAHEANSHAGHGWEELTDAIIAEVARQPQPVVFMLWGKPAQRKKKIIADASMQAGVFSRKYVLESSHPSPLSVYRGFDGCNHFKTCNEILEENNIGPIKW